METDKNPADDASRGLYVQNLIENSRWWNGPDFLGKPLNKQSILESAEPMDNSLEDPEIEKTSAITTQSQERFSLPGCLRYFSSWHKPKRAVAVCLRLQKKYRYRPSFKASKEDRYFPIKTKELEEAETAIVKSVHCISAQDRTLRKTKRKTSTLSKMDPFHDSVGVLRVGGRLKHSDLSTAVKHPIH